MAEKTMCGNPQCSKHKVYSGGRFKLVAGEWFCEECAKWRGQIGAPAANLYEFTTSHFNGQPVHVKGLSHLRQLEKKYGVSSCVANMDSNNWDHHG